MLLCEQSTDTDIGLIPVFYHKHLSLFRSRYLLFVKLLASWNAILLWHNDEFYGMICKENRLMLISTRWRKLLIECGSFHKVLNIKKTINKRVCLWGLQRIFSFLLVVQFMILIIKNIGSDYSAFLFYSSWKNYLWHKMSKESSVL